MPSRQSLRLLYELNPVKLLASSSKQRGKSDPKCVSGQPELTWLVGATYTNNPVVLDPIKKCTWLRDRPTANTRITDNHRLLLTTELLWQWSS